jgi:S-adenosylmethionine decarboxylase
MEAWGQHLILDLSGCPKDKISDGQHIKNWTKDLVTAIEMVAYGEPLLEHFATHDAKTGGYTLVQLIETSNICAHFAENRGEVYIDIFSCKSFDNTVAEAVCRKYFEPAAIKTHTLIRGEVRELQVV